MGCYGSNFSECHNDIQNILGQIMTSWRGSVPNSIIALVQSFDNFFTQKIIPDGHAYSVIEIWKYIAVNKQDISQEC